METLTAGDATVTIDHRHGGRIAQLRVGDLDVLVPKAGDALTWGSYPMAPYAGRIAFGRFTFEGQAYQQPIGLPPHAIHGTVHQAPWGQLAPGRLSADLGSDWPFLGRVTQAIDLHDDHLAMTLTVHAEHRMPVTVGWHPWFRRRLDRGEDARYTFSATKMYDRDDTGIPDGTLVPPPDGPWDDCFTDVHGPATIIWPGALRIDVDSDCSHLVVFDQLPHAVCIEPQSGPPDAHNSGISLAVVDEGETLERTMTWRWSDG